jgi:hypothetical protein
MLEKMKALMSLFKQGSAVADPAKWKNRQISATMLAGLIIAIVQLARAFGYEIPIDTDTATAIAGGFIAVFNTVFTVVTSKHVGLPTSTVRETKQALPSDEQPAEEESATVQVEATSNDGRGVINTSVDDDVRARAIEWSRQHTSTNVFTNDA